MKNCAIVDLFSVHDHVIPSQIEALQELGFEVKVLSPTKKFKEVSSLLPDLNYECFEIPRDWITTSKWSEMKSALLGHFPLVEELKNFDLVVLNTLRTELHLTSEITKQCKKVIAISHTPAHATRQRRYRDFLQQGHRPFVLSEQVGETYQLPWFCPLTYAGAQYLSYDQLGDETVFCVPGTVRFTGRTYMDLVKCVKSLNNNGYNNFNFKIVGRHDRKDGPDFLRALHAADLSENFSIISEVSHEEFLKELINSDFILPLIDKSVDKNGARHYSDMITSSIFLAIGLERNILAEKTLSDCYKLGDVAFTHDSGALESGIISALNTDFRERQTRRLKLRELKSSLQMRSLENLREMVGSLFP